MAELSDKARRLLMAVAQNDPMAFTEAAEMIARLEAVASAARLHQHFNGPCALCDALRRLDGDGT